MEYQILTLLSVCLGVPVWDPGVKIRSFEVKKVNVVLASDESSGL